MKISSSTRAYVYCSTPVAPTYLFNSVLSFFLSFFHSFKAPRIPQCTYVYNVYSIFYFGAIKNIKNVNMYINIIYIINRYYIN